MIWPACPVWLIALVCEWSASQLLGWVLWCLGALWHACAGQCLDDTLGLGLQGLTVVS